MTSISPIKQLPPEVLHMIFTYLPRHIPELRLLCKSFADIGLHYLLSSYHLIFKKSSFERLLEISQHPVLSKCIKSIFYEADTLSEYDTRKEWEEHISDYYCPDFNELSTIGDRNTGTARAQRASRRAYVKCMQGPRSSCSARQFREAYSCYRQCISDQREMIALDYNAESINDAIKRLPNLVSLEMSMHYCLGSRTKCVESAFSPTLYRPCGDHHQPDHEGVAQLRSLLFGALESSRRIEELHCGYVDWKFFDAEADTFARLKMAVQNLKVLELYISTNSSRDDHNDDSNYHQAIIECASYLKGGRLRDFLSAAPNLTQLFVEFDSDVPQSPARLIDVVGTTTWPSLRLVYFSLLSFTSNDLIQFYRRHSTTLQDIGFDDIQLLQGTWQDLFPKIKDTLELQHVKISGDLCDSTAEYYFGMPSRAACFGDHPPLVKRVVERYLLECPKDSLLPDLSEVVECEEEQAFNSDDSDLESTDFFDDMWFDDSEIYTLDGSEVSATEDSSIDPDIPAANIQSP